MPKNTNMGRASHRAQDAELNQTEPARNAAKRRQPTRPTQNPSQGKKDHRELP